MKIADIMLIHYVRMCCCYLCHHYPCYVTTTLVMSPIPILLCLLLCHHYVCYVITVLVVAILVMLSLSLLCVIAILVVSSLQTEL